MKLRALLLAACCLPLLAQTPANPVTETSADLGPCSADFHVTDMAGKPLYNAKIRTVIRYGFLSKRKLEIEIGTNSDGRARITHLPAEAKKPIEFSISSGAISSAANSSGANSSPGDTATRTYDPATNCHASYDIPLGKKD